MYWIGILLEGSTVPVERDRVGRDFNCSSGTLLQLTDFRICQTVNLIDIFYKYFLGLVFSYQAKLDDAMMIEKKNRVYTNVKITKFDFTMIYNIPSYSLSIILSSPFLNNALLLSFSPFPSPSPFPAFLSLTFCLLFQERDHPGLNMGKRHDPLQGNNSVRHPPYRTFLSERNVPV